jgi:hypothetical protein
VPATLLEVVGRVGEAPKPHSADGVDRDGEQVGAVRRVPQVLDDDGEED